MITRATEFRFSSVLWLIVSTLATSTTALYRPHRVSHISKHTGSENVPIDALLNKFAKDGKFSRADTIFASDILSYLPVALYSCQDNLLFARVEDDQRRNCRLLFHHVNYGRHGLPALLRDAREETFLVHVYAYDARIGGYKCVDGALDPPCPSLTHIYKSPNPKRSDAVSDLIPSRPLRAARSDLGGLRGESRDFGASTNNLILFLRKIKAYGNTNRP